MPTGGTIIAQATPAGFSPRAIIRISGPETRAVLGSLTGNEPTPRRAVSSTFKLGPHRLPVLMTCFAAPASYTGEDSAEITLPGNTHLIERVMDAMLAIPGVRRAGPGEFSARAYLNDKLSIQQAEGIAQLVSAASDLERDAAERLLSGETASMYAGWTEELTTLLALVEAGIDFTDQEDVTAISTDDLRSRTVQLRSEITDHLGAQSGHTASDESPTVVLVGAPNAGKSTLFNALLGRDRAVTSQDAGTTRDVLREPLDLSADLSGAGTIVLIDLPGLDANVAGEIDTQSQTLAHDVIAHADAIVHCDPAARFASVFATRSGASTIRVRTKGDLPGHAADSPDAVAVCALDGWHLAVLRRAIADAALGAASTGVPARHRRSLGQAANYLDDTLSHIDDSHPAPAAPELIAGSLRAALDELGELTGRISPDDVIGRIFATFCVGK